jgi:hypothetical protein
MTARTLEKQLLGLIESGIEDTTIPDAIAAHADKHAGKPVTKIHAAAIEVQIGLPVRIRRQYGMTQVSWAVGKEANPWLVEHSVLLAHSETNVSWPTGDELRAKNPAYFGASHARNAQRRQLLAEHQARICVCRAQSDSCSGCWPENGQPSTSVVTRAAAAIIKIREAQAELAKLLAYDEPLYVMRTEVEKLIKA